MLVVNTLLALLPALALAAPTTPEPKQLDKRQKTNGCNPTFDANARYAIQSTQNTGLYWNATFPTRDYVQAFTDVKLANRINNDPSSVSEWSLVNTGNGPWKISSRVPKDSPWYLSYYKNNVDGELGSSNCTTQFDIFCSYNSDQTTCDSQCSITTSTYDADGFNHCIQFDASKGGKVVVGDALHGPYDCPSTVNFVKIA